MTVTLWYELSPAIGAPAVGGSALCSYPQGEPKRLMQFGGRRKTHSFSYWYKKNSQDNNVRSKTIKNMFYRIRKIINTIETVICLDIRWKSEKNASFLFEAFFLISPLTYDLQSNHGLQIQHWNTSALIPKSHSCSKRTNSRIYLRTTNKKPCPWHDQEI